MSLFPLPLAETSVIQTLQECPALWLQQAWCRQSKCSGLWQAQAAAGGQRARGDPIWCISYIPWPKKSLDGCLEDPHAPRQPPAHRRSAFAVQSGVRQRHRQGLPAHREPYLQFDRVASCHGEEHALSRGSAHNTQQSKRATTPATVPGSQAQVRARRPCPCTTDGMDFTTSRAFSSPSTIWKINRTNANWPGGVGQVDPPPTTRALTLTSLQLPSWQFRPPSAPCYCPTAHRRSP